MAKDFGAGAGSMLKNVKKKSEDVNNAMNVVNIDIDLIHENKDNADIFNMDGIAVLAERIKKVGFDDPVDVMKIKEGEFAGEYELVSGHRRYRAARAAELKQIPCIVNKELNSVAKAEKLLGSNIYNRDLRPMDYARAIEYYKKEVLEPQKVAKKREECCKKFNIGRNKLLHYECLLKLIPELQEIVDMPNFPYTSIVSLKIYKLSAKEQKIVYERICELLENADNDEKVISHKLLEARLKDILMKLMPEKYAEVMAENTEASSGELVEQVSSTESMDEELVLDDTVLTDSSSGELGEEIVLSGDAENLENPVGEPSEVQPGMESEPIKKSSMEDELAKCVIFMQIASKKKVKEKDKLLETVNSIKKLLAEIEKML